ncbi:hypothetical protein TNCV_3172741 [Trichonephila clavipes]|nr:hypothetical protein TNCV_3172741 [Trichonephila clavipes]
MTMKPHPKILTQVTIKKVKSLILKENPLTQRFFAPKIPGFPAFSTGGNDRSKWLRQCTVKFPKGLMIVAGFSDNGKLEIQKISSKAKINSLYYQQHILEPISEEEIPTLCRKDIDKVELQMNKASSHTSNAAYLGKKESETGIKYSAVDKIVVKLPYASPMVFVHLVC